MRTRATELIKRFKSSYNGCKTLLEFQVGQYLGGDHNKLLRQEVILQLTGEKEPLTKCGLSKVTDALKANFDQIKIF